MKKKAIMGNLHRDSDNTFSPIILFSFFFFFCKSESQFFKHNNPLNSPALALTHRLIKLYMFR